MRKNKRTKKKRYMYIFLFHLMSMSMGHVYWISQEKNTKQKATNVYIKKKKSQHLFSPPIINYINKRCEYARDQKTIYRAVAGHDFSCVYIYFFFILPHAISSPFHILSLCAHSIAYSARVHDVSCGFYTLTICV